MENIFEELLDSYHKLKKRTLVIKLDEVIEHPKLDPKAEAKAKEFISFAISKKSQESPLDKTDVNGIGQIWVAKEGQSKGKVVFNGFGGHRHLKPYPISSNSSDGPAFQNFLEFVDILSPEEPKEEKQSMEDDLLDPLPVEQPQIQANPEIQKLLMKCFQETKSLILGNFFLPDESKPMWMEEGDGMFQDLATKFTMAPGSFEDKLNNAYILLYDRMSDSFMQSPLDEYDKEIGVKTFYKFLCICNKFKDDTFTDEDAVWVKHHLSADHLGLWFRDPVKLEYGLALSFKESALEAQDRLFVNLIESYNRAYKQWTEDHKSKYAFPITLKPRLIPFSNRTNDLNDIRGKAAEELQIAIHKLSVGDIGSFRTIVTNLKNNFGQNLVMAYTYGDSFKLDQNVANEQLAGYLSLIQGLSTLARKEGNPASIDEVIFSDVLKRLFRIEAKSILQRMPISIEHKGLSVGKGLKADIVETYGSPQEAQLALQKFGVEPSEAMDIIYQNGKINVGIKTSVKPDEIKLGTGSIENLLRSLSGESDQSFMSKICKELGIFTFVEESKVKEGIRILKEANDKLELSLSKIANPKMEKQVLRRQTLTMLNDIVRKQFGFDDLISVDNFNAFDLDNEQEMENLKGYIKRKVMAAIIRKGSEDGRKEYVAILAMAICSMGCSLQNQLTDVRFLSTEESLVINHNKSIQDACLGLLQEKYTIDKSNSSTITILNGSLPVMRLQLARTGKKSMATATMSLSYLRSISKKPMMESTDIMYRFLKNQKTMIEDMLSSYHCPKKNLLSS